MLKSGASRFVGLTLVALTYASAATADPVVITGGSISLANGVDLPGFTLTAPDSSFTGILPTSGVTCCVFAPGDVVQLDRTFALSTLIGQPTAQIVNGVSYPLAFVTGTLAFTTVPFTAPTTADATFSFSTPFVASGQIVAFADFARAVPLFSVGLTGSGTATVSGRTVSGPALIGENLSYVFTPAAPAPTPEPTSALLLVAGLACVMMRRRLSHT